MENEIDIASKLYSIIIERIRNELPERHLTFMEMDGIWYDIYGRVCRGESEQNIENYCKTVKFSTPKPPRLRNGYAG